jgi:hypothetical protein
MAELPVEFRPAVGWRESDGISAGKVAAVVQTAGVAKAGQGLKELRNLGAGRAGEALGQVQGAGRARAGGEVFAGNLSEPETLEKMLQRLLLAPTVVMDAGIATEENLLWLQAQDYRYLVVSRERHKRFDPEQATLIREDATALHWARMVPTEDTRPGVYCLRTNRTDWDDAALWGTCTLLTDLDAVFRSLKSELGRRLVYPHKTKRVDGHLFISVLGYHLVHTLRLQLKAQGINLSWDSLRDQFDSQERVTVVLQRDDGTLYHIRKATRPDPHQLALYNALGLPHLPGRTKKTVIDPSAEVTQI